MPTRGSVPVNEGYRMASQVLFDVLPGSILDLTHTALPNHAFHHDVLNLSLLTLNLSQEKQNNTATGLNRHISLVRCYCFPPTFHYSYRCVGNPWEDYVPSVYLSAGVNFLFVAVVHFISSTKPEEGLSISAIRILDPEVVGLVFLNNSEMLRLKHLPPGGRKMWKPIVMYSVNCKSLWCDVSLGSLEG